MVRDDNQDTNTK